MFWNATCIIFFRLRNFCNVTTVHANFPRNKLSDFNRVSSSVLHNRYEAPHIMEWALYFCFYLLDDKLSQALTHTRMYFSDGRQIDSSNRVSPLESQSLFPSINGDNIGQVCSQRRRAFTANLARIPEDSNKRGECSLKWSSDQGCGGPTDCDWARNDGKIEGMCKGNQGAVWGDKKGHINRGGNVKGTTVWHQNWGKCKGDHSHIKSAKCYNYQGCLFSVIISFNCEAIHAWVLSIL